MIIVAITAFISAFMAIKLFKPLAVDVGLLDNPSVRKHHNGQIPLIGGISIFIELPKSEMNECLQFKFFAFHLGTYIFFISTYIRKIARK